MKNRKMTRHSQIIIGVLTVILAIYLATALFFWKSMNPYHSMRAQAITIAKKKTDLKTPEAFDIATTDTTTYSIVGIDKDNKEIGVLIPKKAGTITVVNLNEGVSPSTLTTKNTKSVVLALYKNKPAWEVNNSNGFKVYDFKSGKALID
ncbi:DUF5590 domain-containing protein [Lactococcus allomyrinae]|uniref:Cell wall elongation regulator TseB-like domain-containing protein n=1 Tax=Lactococcus allomyrinae TaxID=2419773 RepID=A0A387BIM5_9LACT|nr:DUF5590 domain-containing protein [Lactococcus allomyrinae]AYG00887.1 hypothetical protein D7I46_07125 [Lactococcus allomyrinae]